MYNSGHMKEDSLLRAVLLFIGGLVAVPLAFLWHGFVMAKLWVWHVMSNFPNAPELSISSLIGIMALLRVMTYAVNYNTEKPDTEFTAVQTMLRDMYVAFTVPLIALVVGYIFS
jgi:hypothetical protein